MTEKYASPYFRQSPLDIIGNPVVSFVDNLSQQGDLAMKRILSIGILLAGLAGLGLLLWAALAIGARAIDLEVDGTEVVGEGELMMVAELVSSEALNFMVRHTGSSLHVAAGKERLDQLGLGLMVPGSQGPRGTAMVMSVNAARASGSAPAPPCT